MAEKLEQWFSTEDDFAPQVGCLAIFGDITDFHYCWFAVLLASGGI